MSIIEDRIRMLITRERMKLLGLVTETIRDNLYVYGGINHDLVESLFEDMGFNNIHEFCIENVQIENSTIANRMAGHLNLTSVDEFQLFIATILYKEIEDFLNILQETYQEWMADEIMTEALKYLESQHILEGIKDELLDQLYPEELVKEFSLPWKNMTSTRYFEDYVQTCQEGTESFTIYTADALDLAHDDRVMVYAEDTVEISGQNWEQGLTQLAAMGVWSMTGAEAYNLFEHLEEASAEWLEMYEPNIREMMLEHVRKEITLNGT